MMDNNSPSTYGPPNWAPGVSSSSFKSPVNSSQPNKNQDSPDFTPYSYSSPIKHHTRNNKWNNNRRYFNMSGGNFSNSGNLSSPNSRTHHNRRNRGKHNRVNNDSGDYSNISHYFHPSMLEDPWLELEKQLKESNGSPEDLKTDTSVQN